MIRAALFAAALLFVAPATAAPLGAQIGGGIGHIWIYGDSYNDGNDMQPFLNARGITDFQIENMAKSGAALMPGRYASTCTEAGADINSTSCPFQIRYQAIEHPSTGSCEVTQQPGNDLDGSASEPSCITEQVLSPQDMCIIQASSNDIASGSYTNWDPESGTDYSGQLTDALDDVLDVMDAVGIRCIIATGAPMAFGAASNGNDPGQDPTGGHSQNLAIEDYIIPTYQQAVLDHPTHVFVNVYQVFRDYQTQHGDQALADLYKDCDTLGGDQVTACTDGVHPSLVVQSTGFSGQGIMFNAMIDAMFRLNTTRLHNAPIFVGN
jgi:lysophospholipase L1-like esterase